MSSVFACELMYELCFQFSICQWFFLGNSCIGFKPGIYLFKFPLQKLRDSPQP